MPGRGWEDREIDIVAGDDIFHHRAAADVFHRKIRGLDLAALNTLRRLVMMLGTADELAAAFVEAPTLAGRAA